MGVKSIIIKIHCPITNQEIEVILTDQFINMGGHVMEYIVGGHRGVNNIHQHFIGLMNNSLIC